MTYEISCDVTLSVPIVVDAEDELAANDIVQNLLMTDYHDVVVRMLHDELGSDPFIETEYTGDGGYPNLTQDEINDYINGCRKKDVRDLDFNDFFDATVGYFNAHHCDGNPIVGNDDDPLFFYRLADGRMVTLVRDGREWTCEVADGWETGIAQSGHHKYKYQAWEDTKRQLLEEE